MTRPESRLRPDAAVGGMQYLEATVRSASPARLRLMLIERGVDVAGHLAQTWRSNQNLGPNEHSIKLLDLLNELLSGVVGGQGDGSDDVCEKVADLYVFLAKHLVAAESTSDASAIDEIKTVLEVEAETWRAVCAQATPRHSSAGSTQTGLNLEG